MGWFKKLISNPTSLRAALVTGLTIGSVFVGNPKVADQLKTAAVLLGADGLRVAANAKDSNKDSK